MDKQRAREMDIPPSPDENSTKRESFMKPIPELKVENVDGSPKPPKDGNHVPLLKTISNHSGYSVQTTNSTNSRFKTLMSKLSASTKNLDNLSVDSGPHSAVSSINRDFLHEDFGEDMRASAVDRWNLIKLKTPDIGNAKFPCTILIFAIVSSNI